MYYRAKEQLYEEDYCPRVLRGGGDLNAFVSRFWGYTLAEIIIVMLIIAVIVSVTIGITKAKLDNVVSYTYYNAYSTLRKISTEMLADWNPKDPEYKQALVKKDLFAMFSTNVHAAFYPDVTCDIDNLCTSAGTFFTQDLCEYAGAHWCNEKEHRQGTGCFTCCTPKCTKSCPFGTELDTCTCTCSDYICPDGSLAEDMDHCPEYTCLDGSVVGNPVMCPNFKCWDGSYEINEADCPPHITCWDGSKKSDYSECPPCPNKPEPLPCGQGWDEHTCQLTGSAKTCPSGQHLNSSCNCVTDCPTDLSPCKICNSETGIVSQNPAINRTCSDETYEWSEEQCKCIPSPRTLPRKGMNFCKLFERHANIMSGSDVCSGSVISSGTTDFSNKSPDITLRNGLLIYNMHSDAGAISMLANNTQGGVYDGVPNTNSYGYTVYVDIDGSKGDSLLWSDVYPFYITLSGKVIPAYDADVNPDGSGGDSVRHLQVSAENENYASGRRSTKWLARSVSFKEGACITGYVGDATPYCKTGTSFTKAGECTTNYNSMCRVKQIMPVKFFF